MARKVYTDPWVRKAKWLMQALILSGTLNVCLLCTFIYSAIRESKASKVEPLARSSDVRDYQNLQELLEKYSLLSFQDLLLRLGNTDHVESGYTKRDVALACLVAFHSFNIERALGGGTLQKREVAFRPQKEKVEQKITIFPGLADYQYQAIVHYAKTEKWPITSKGLFLEIQKGKPPYDPSLVEAFYLTPEFHFIHLLFTKTGVSLKKETIVALLSQCDWEMLSTSAESLKKSTEFSDTQRQHFLMQMLEKESKLAAKILLEVDQEFCVKQLDNGQVLLVCNLLGERTNASFLKELLLAPRSDEVWKKGAEILYEQAAEEVPAQLELQVAIEKFIELKAPAKSVEISPPVAKKRSLYKVKSGDSLWKIARELHTTVQALREENLLTSDQLKVGQELLIP
jgi:LysM repeat protein